MSSATQLNSENILLGLLNEFEDIFDVMLGKWSTEPIDNEQKPDSKTVNSQYYLVPRIKKENFQKEIKNLVEIVLLTPLQKSEKGMITFIIHKK